MLCPCHLFYNGQNVLSFCVSVCVCVFSRQIHDPCFYLNMKIRTNMVLLCLSRCSLHSACGSATAMDSECGTWTSILFDV